MSQQLERLLPVLSAIPGVNIPATVLQGASIAASQRKIELLEQALQLEVSLLQQLIENGTVQLDHDHLRSDAFTANVMQALRAAEVAESEYKLRFIARALAGCALSFPPPRLDRVQTMRIIEGLSERELRAFTGLFALLDPIDPYADGLAVGSPITVAGLTRQEFTAALLGLQQLGLLTRAQAPAEPWAEPAASTPVWQLTPLAQQVAVLSRLHRE
ncbi:hypothetical protein [Deinococcus sonorensis]|uniref:Uncharacterized protein n=2 Tax=Deinococcus sonorensis TaxID=309891 RepID=A0AAU7U7A0_9DEIO